MNNDINTTKPEPTKNDKQKQYYLLLLLVIFGALVLFLIWNKHSDKTSTTSNQSSASTKNAAIVTMSLSPTSQQVTPGSNLVLEVWADSGSMPVNAVQANLTYPVDKLTFVSIDSSSSAFVVTAPSTGGSGKVAIARGNIKPVTGKVLVAKVSFTVNTASSGSVPVSFGQGSALVSSTSHTNVLTKTYGGTYSL
jgi:preprotein translocase subunit YajC